MKVCKVERLESQRNPSYVNRVICRVKDIEKEAEPFSTV